jgi:hypothetical protein
MTPNNNASVPLNELNKLIAESRGISIEELAVNDGTQVSKKTVKKDDPTRTTSSSVNEEGASSEIVSEDLTPSQMRSKADKLFKEAQILRKQADEVDPPKSKKKSATVEA